MAEGTTNPENPDSPIAPVDSPTTASEAQTYPGYPLKENNVGKVVDTKGTAAKPDRSFSEALPFKSSIGSIVTKLLRRKPLN